MQKLLYMNRKPRPFVFFHTRLLFCMMVWGNTEGLFGVVARGVWSALCGYSSWISNISEHENVIHWLWMSDILYVYVFCVIPIPSDVARSRFMAVVCSKRTSGRRRRRRRRILKVNENMVRDCSRSNGLFWNTRKPEAVLSPKHCHVTALTVFSPS